MERHIKLGLPGALVVANVAGLHRADMMHSATEVKLRYCKSLIWHARMLLSLSTKKVVKVTQSEEV